MQLYNSESIHQLSWPSDPDSQYAQRVLSAFVEKGARHYIKNADCAVEILSFDEQRIPLVLPHLNDQNSYVCSPRGQYIRYGQREIELELHDKKAAQWLSSLALKGFEQFAAPANFDQVVFVNNWLLSTNLYPSLSAMQMQQLTDFLVAKFPDRAIVFRSVNPVLNNSVFNFLAKIGYRQVLSRQVYLFDTKAAPHRKKKAYKEDLRFRKKRLEYQWTSDISPEWISDIQRFYGDLYLKKYSNINPQFTAAFYADSVANHWLQYRLLLKEGQPFACLGYFNRDEVMTTPIVGYDTSLPQSEGFYRLITLQIIEEGVKNDMFIHMSSGASEYKRLRGSTACMEYNMVYIKHLPWNRQLPWRILEGLTKYVAGPIVEKYGL